MEEKKTLKNIILVGVLAFMFIAFYLYNEHEKNIRISELLKNCQTTNGTILEYSYDGYKHGSSLKFSFYFNHIKYSSAASEVSFWKSDYYGMRSYLIGKSFPVIFNVNNPELNKILITPMDFRFYNLPFPDSLQWVREKLGE
jgi:hypothetical protein